MSAWAPKRFWKEASVIEAEGGFTVSLDGRAVKTPAKAALVVPTRAMAEAIAAEWDAQEGVIKPDTMPWTRSANSSIDKLAIQRDAVIDMLAEYGGSDLLCYRVDQPAELVARQKEGWDPLLVWAEETFGAKLQTTAGLMPIAQDEAAVAALKAPLLALTNFELAAFHDLVAISGSLVLALAVIKGRLTPAEAFALSRMDETFQIEQWGKDEEAAEIDAIKAEAYEQAGRFYGLCR